jgi:beta-lactamase superfamily II metal-dependent hydrolase
MGRPSDGIHTRMPTYLFIGRNVATDTQRPGLSDADFGLQVDDAAAKGEYYFLDVGDEKYGECTLVVFGQVRVLIDGSHQADIRSRNGRDSIPDQLKAILKEEAPHRITLVVVTHGHADHIGCLPDLTAQDVIRPEWAFITDPELGFGRIGGDALPIESLGDPHYRMVSAMREEDAGDLPDDELRAFIDAAVRVETRYANFVDDLKALGTNVVLNKGQGLPQGLKEALKGTGATLLGPTRRQLELCAQQISTTNKDAMDLADAILRGDVSMDDATLYRAAIKSVDQRTDALRNPRGSGMNCQSITFAFGPKNARVLLAGDMQFTEPGVRDIDGVMAELRQRVIDAGPYKVFKTTHHTSHNGQDDGFLSELGDPPIIVHSGGLNDATHPDPGVLEVLRGRRQQILLARTDRNGRIAVRPHLDGRDAVEQSRGRLNDFTENVRDSEPAAPEAAVVPAVQVVAGAASRSTPQVIIVNLPSGPVDFSVAGVDITIRSPSTPAPAPRFDRLGQFTVGGERRERSAGAPRISLAGGKSLPSLLFVTHADRLAKNIGRTEAGTALDAIRAAGHALCEVDGTAEEAAAAVRSELERTDGIQGVVLIGGYDVVPSAVVDVLGANLRHRLGASLVRSDDDHFIVWSDEEFGDRDGDRVGELPVSRIPDARKSSVLLNAMTGPGSSAFQPQRFGVRNVYRPFANGVWTSVRGNNALNVSEKFLNTNVVPATMTTSDVHYFMLHGDWRDGRGFWGELQDQSGYTDAFFVGNVPSSFGGVAFAGCCWGALTVSQKAKDAGAAPIAPRVAERSIALTYLQAGAKAFVGCTGAHYSGPDEDPEVNYAFRMHSSFWTALSSGGAPPAMALHLARQEYSQFIAERSEDMEPIDLARRLKNRAQFTCLGLGW